MPFSGVRMLVAAFWAGSLWAAGLDAALVFHVMPGSMSMLAGSVVGFLFRTEAWICVACAGAYIALLLVERRAGGAFPKILLYLALGMLACTLLGYFALQPFMAELRAVPRLSGGVMDAAVRARFGMLHGISSGMYLLQCVLAAVLVWKSR